MTSIFSVVAGTEGGEAGRGALKAFPVLHTTMKCILAYEKKVLSRTLKRVVMSVVVTLTAVMLNEKVSVIQL